MATTGRIWKAAARAVLAAAMLAAASGCTSAMIRTTPFGPSPHVRAPGAAAEPPHGRILAWPLAYWNRPNGSAMWPFVTFSDEHFGLFPLYSQYRQDGPGKPWDEFNVLWPLAQADTRSGQGWVLPLAFWGDGWQTVFPFYWNGDGYNALLPLWLKTRHTFTTPLGGWTSDGWWIVPWLGSWGDRPYPGDRYWVAALGLGAGGHRLRGGSLNRWFWVFPLVSRNAWFDADGRELRNSKTSVLFGLLASAKRQAGRNGTDASFRVLFGLGRWRWHDGVLARSHFFPLWSRRRSPEMPARMAWLDAGTLPAEARPLEPSRRAKLLHDMREARMGHEKVYVSSRDGNLVMGTRRFPIPEIHLYDWECRDANRWFYLFGNTDVLKGRFVDAEGRTAAWDGPAEAVRCDLSFEGGWGPPFLLHAKTSREVSFDVADGAKTRDAERSSFSILGLLYRHDGQRGVPGEADFNRHSVLWRLFRWEKDAGKGTAVDFLFLPIWRSGIKTEEPSPAD